MVIRQSVVAHVHIRCKQNNPMISAQLNVMISERKQRRCQSKQSVCVVSQSTYVYPSWLIKLNGMESNQIKQWCCSYSYSWNTQCKHRSMKSRAEQKMSRAAEQNRARARRASSSAVLGSSGLVFALLNEYIESDRGAENETEHLDESARPRIQWVITLSTCCPTCCSR